MTMGPPQLTPEIELDPEASGQYYLLNLIPVLENQGTAVLNLNL